MTIATNDSGNVREPQLVGQTVVVIGGSAGIGFETAKRARAEGAEVVLTGRNPERLQHAAAEVDALSSVAFDATDLNRLERFFDELPTSIDHIMVTAGSPYYARLNDIDFEQARRSVDEHFWLMLHIARLASLLRGGAPHLLPGRCPSLQSVLPRCTSRGFDLRHVRLLRGDERERHRSAGGTPVSSHRCANGESGAGAGSAFASSESIGHQRGARNAAMARTAPNSAPLAKLVR